MTSDRDDETAKSHDSTL